MSRRLALLALPLVAAGLAACAGEASVVGRSEEAILLRVGDEASVPQSRRVAADHCDEFARQPVLVSTDRLGDDVLVRWECR